MNKKSKSKKARAIIGIGGYSSGKDPSNIDKALEIYNQLTEQRK
jgi:flagellar biosynthesis/type III secretory pathway ATPase